MNQKPNLELSPELEVYRPQIEATIKPYIKIQLTENSNPTWWQSKFGGLPYMPRDCTYPRSEAGEYLYLLGQINFAEVPRLAPLPQKGILQFYIFMDDQWGLWGLDCDNKTKQDKFRVIYFPDASLSEQEIVTDFSFLPSKIDSQSLPFDGSCEIRFEIKHAPMSFEDCQFDIFDFDDISDSALDEYFEKTNSSKHKMLGYPGFTQQDPRTYLTEEEPYILLIQINSDDSNNSFEIMWGDSGIANFFIKQSALERLDFSDVLYNWDCT